MEVLLPNARPRSGLAGVQSFICGGATVQSELVAGLAPTRLTGNWLSYSPAGWPAVRLVQHPLNWHTPGERPRKSTEVTKMRINLRLPLLLGLLTNSRVSSWNDHSRRSLFSEIFVFSVCFVVN